MPGRLKRRLLSGPRDIATPRLLWSIKETAANVNQGSTATFTIYMDRHGNTPVPMSIWIRFPTTITAPPTLATSADFTSPGSGSIPSALNAAALATTGVTFVDGGGSLFRFDFDVTFIGPLVINRVTKDWSTFVGDKQTGFELYDATVGEIIEPVAAVTIRDVAVLVNSVVPTIDDTTPEDGQTISVADPGTWVGAPAADSYLYQWQRGTADILGATTAGYTATAQDVGSTLRVGVRAINAIGSSVIVYSAATTAVAAVVTPPPAPYGEVGPDGFYVVANAPAAGVIGTPTASLPGTVTSLTMRERTLIYLGPSDWGTSDIFALNAGSIVVATGRTPDFAGIDIISPSDGVTNYGKCGTPWYECEITFHKSDAADEVKIYRMRPKYQAIVPTGDGTANEILIGGVEPTGTNRYCTLIAQNAPNRTIKFPRTLHGVVARQASTTTDLVSHHITQIGHPQVIALRDSPVRMNGGHHVYTKDLAMRTGGYPTGSPLASDRDGHQISAAYELYYENCDFSDSYDEVCSWGRSFVPIQPYCRRIMFKLCLFAQPGYAPVHRSEPAELSHPYGSLSNDYSVEIAMIFCAIIGFEQRTPAILRNFGILIQNCLLIYGGDSGVIFSNHQPVTIPTFTTAIIRNNLMRPAYNYSLKARAFKLSGVGAGTEILQEGNYFIGNYTDHFDFNDRIVNPVTDTLIKNSGNLVAFVSYEPFKVDSDYGLMPTATAQNRSDLCTYVLDHVGVRERDGGGALIAGDAAMSEIGGRIINYLRTGTNYDGSPFSVFATPTANYSLGYLTGTGGALLLHPATGGISKPNFAADLCPVGAPGDACRAVGGFVTGAPGDTWPLH